MMLEFGLKINLKKKIIIIFLLIALLIPTASLSDVDQTEEEPLVISCLFGEVTFQHKKHLDIECNVCHHTDIADQKCMECHNKNSEINNREAFHLCCVNCHQKNKNGPVNCLDCHK